MPAERADEAVRRRNAGDAVLLDALAVGLSYEEASGLAGVSARTARRRLTDPTFAAELARRRAVRVSAVTGRLTALCERATEVLADCLDSERPADRLRAAELILSMTRRLRLDVDVDVRLASLERSGPPEDRDQESPEALT